MPRRLARPDDKTSIYNSFYAIYRTLYFSCVGASAASAEMQRTDAYYLRY